MSNWCDTWELSWNTWLFLNSLLKLWAGLLMQMFESNDANVVKLLSKDEMQQILSCFLASFCPTNSKFASCSDDGTVRIWDFLRCHEERILRGQYKCEQIQLGSSSNLAVPVHACQSEPCSLLWLLVDTSSWFWQVTEQTWSVWTGIHKRHW